MNIEIPSFKSIELKKISDCKELDYKILSYNLDEDLLKGILNVNGKYYTDTLETYNEFNEDIEFSVYFDKSGYTIEEVRCQHFDYEVVVGRGIEVLFTLIVDYIESEDIKEEIVEEVDELLKDALMNRDDSFLDQSDSKIINRIEDENNEDESKQVEVVNIEAIDTNSKFYNDYPEKYSTYRILFVKEESELEAIATKYNKSVSQLYQENDYEVDKRVIIQCDE